MMITCDCCSSSYDIDEHYAGRSAKCKKCDTVLKIPKVAELEIKKTVGEQRKEIEAKRTCSCPFCGEEVLAKAIKCRHCSEFLDGRDTSNSSPAISTGNGNPNNVVVNIDSSLIGGRRSSSRRNYKTKTAAVLWCLFLGGIGAHHFYLGNTLRAVLYVLFCWTYIPAILAVIDLIVIACTGEETFDQKYN